MKKCFMYGYIFTLYTQKFADQFYNLKWGIHRVGDVLLRDGDKERLFQGHRHRREVQAIKTKLLSKIGLDIKLKRRKGKILPLFVEGDATIIK